MTKKKLIYNIGIMLADFIAYFVICLFSSLLFKGNIAYNFVMSALVLSALKVIISYILKNYNLLWMYSIRHNLVRFGIVVYALDLIVLILSQLPEISSFSGFSARIYTIVMITEFAYMGTSRYLISYVLNKYYHKKKKADKINRTLIIGAGNAGVMVRNELCTLELGNKVVAFLDDSKDKIGTYINGVKVYGPIDKVNEVVDSLDIEKIIIALPSAGITRIKEITNLIDYKNEEVLILPDKTKLLQSDISTNIRKVEIADLLGRKTIDVVDENTAKFYKDKVVLITGGGGSIGSELCRQVAKMEPKQIIILDIYENCAYDIQQELKFKYGNNLDLKVEIISITNKPALERVFEKYKPNIVVMAAAHKHVPLMENNVVEAVENNVFGTLNTVELAEKYGVDRVHMVSTDKAVNPTSVMGATKRICEMIVQAHSSIKQHTTFSITRFGNVLGSAGSVIPLFNSQIEAGGPVTLTDYRIIRYFMTIPEASQLVLQSASMAKNGELFVLDMGEPVKIYDLAKNLIRLSGFEPDVDIKIIETGLRPGEKLYEELLVKTEELDKTDNELIFIERDKPLSLEDIASKLEKLLKGIKEGNDAKMKEVIKSVVPTFIEKEQANKNFDVKEVK